MRSHPVMLLGVITACASYLNPLCLACKPPRPSTCTGMGAIWVPCNMKIQKQVIDDNYVHPQLGISTMSTPHTTTFEGCVELWIQLSAPTWATWIPTSSPPICRNNTVWVELIQISRCSSRVMCNAKSSGARAPITGAWWGGSRPHKARTARKWGSWPMLYGNVSYGEFWFWAY